MSDRLDLNAHGIRLFAGRLYNHDYLWFSSFEISKTAATLPLIHNYALSYALSGFSYGIYAGTAPRYAEDLEEMPAYATPARAEAPVARTRLTQNAVSSLSLRTDDAPRGSNSPSIGWRMVLDPVWRRASPEVEGAAGFAFYLFLRGSQRLPAVVRLGKKGCAVRLEWEEISPAVAALTAGPTWPTHAVNPLDIQGEVLSYDPVSMPPHLAFRVAELGNEWFVFSGAHRVHLPRRFTSAGSLLRPRLDEQTATQSKGRRPKRVGKDPVAPT
jgi:CRISPR-associated protein Csc1